MLTAWEELKLWWNLRISNCTVLGSDWRSIITNPNPIPNPSRSEPNNFSFNSLISFRSPIWTYNYPFKFGTHAPRVSPNRTPENIFERGVVSITYPINFWALHANSSNMAKATQFKFGSHAPRTVLTWPLKNFGKKGVVRVMWPSKFLGINC